MFPRTPRFPRMSAAEYGAPQSSAAEQEAKNRAAAAVHQTAHPGSGVAHGVAEQYHGVAERRFVREYDGSYAAPRGSTAGRTTSPAVDPSIGRSIVVSPRGRSAGASFLGSWGAGFAAAEQGVPRGGSAVTAPTNRSAVWVLL